MKRKFTLITAALALLACLAIPIGSWGQTRAEGDTHDFSQTLQQLLNNNASIPSITIPAQSYPVKKVTISYRYNKTITNAVTMAVTIGGNSWGTEVNSEGTGNNYTTVDFEDDPTTGEIVISFTNNTGDGTGHGTFFVNNVQLTEGAGGAPVPAYTVTLGDDSSTLTETIGGEGVTLPARSDIGDYAFAGWSETNVPTETTTAPTIIPAGEYHPTSNITIYPVYTRTEGGSGTTDVPVSVTISDYATAHSWANGTRYETVTINSDVTATASGTSTSNTGKYYTNGNSWRFYSSESGYMTISTTKGTLKSATITFSNSTLSYNNSNITSGSSVSLSGTSASFYAGGTTYITGISVTYTVSASTTYYWSSPVLPTVVTPTFTPATGTNFGNEGLEVTIACETTGANIYYTLDGSEPTNASTAYSGAINLTTTTTIKAIAYVGSDYSNVATATYTYIKPTVATPTFSPAAGAYTSAQSVSINCETSDVTIYYTTDGTTPTTSSSVYSTAITVDESKTIKAIAVKTNYNDSEVATATYTITLPYTTIPALFTAATSTSTAVVITFNNWVISAVKNKNAYLTDNAGNGLIIYEDGHGFQVNDVLSGTASCNLVTYQGSAELTGLKASTTGLTVAHNGTVNEITTIGIDELGGVNTGALLSYESLTYNGTAFVDASDNTIEPYNTLYEFAALENGKVYNVKGIYKQYTTNTQDKKEILPRSADDIEEVTSTTPSITVDPASVNVTAAGGDGTIDVTYNNITTVVAEVNWCDGNGNAASKPDWIDAEINGSDNNNVYYVVDANDGAARTAYFKVHAYDDDANDVYSDLITITQAAPVAQSNWKLTPFADLTAADVFVIVGKSGDNYYALPSTATTSAPTAVPVTLSGDYLANTVDVTNLKWVMSGNASIVGNMFYSQASTTFEYLYCTNSNNGVRVSSNGTPGKHFTLAANGYLTTTETTDQRYLGIYNNADWRTYDNVAGNIKNQTFYFYKLVTDDVTPVPTKVISGYGSGNDKWYLIAPPVASVGVSAVAQGTYDLYYFDQNADLEWVNQKAHTSTFTTLKSTIGYLYAHETGITLNFEGKPYNGNGVVTLTKVAGKEFSGYNLIGNPYNANATVDKDYYRMNEYGSDIVTGSGLVAAMEGIFVIATNDGETVTFTQSVSSPAPSNQLVMNLSYNTRGSAIDRAIVRFGEGNQLPKFQLFENSTKVYIPQNGKDYAIVRSEAQGELPINFKAEKNGSYTLSFEAENVEMNYLHLIDNLTGADIDLLQTPSYTFNGKTTDYASRFRLVFSANNVNDNQEGNTNFAYINGEEIVILNAEANATLQVVDLTGRIVSSTNVAHSVSTSGMVPGVYVLRLINGTDVKVQKIVVE